MPAGSAQLAKRALVTLLLILARKYDIPAVVANRDSPDAVVLATFKKVSKKVHPDKGGSTQDFQKLNNARDEWNKAHPLVTCGYARHRRRSASLGLVFRSCGCLPKPGDAPSKTTQRWYKSFCNVHGIKEPLPPHRILQVGGVGAALY